MKWILILILTSDVIIPVGVFDTHRQCARALQAWEITQDVKIACVRGKIEGSSE